MYYCSCYSIVLFLVNLILLSLSLPFFNFKFLFWWNEFGSLDDRLIIGHLVSKYIEEIQLSAVPPKPFTHSPQVVKFIYFERLWTVLLKQVNCNVASTVMANKEDHIGIMLFSPVHSGPYHFPMCSTKACLLGHTPDVAK